MEYYDVRDESKLHMPNTFLCEDRNCWCEFANENAECVKNGACILGHKLESYGNYREVYYPFYEPLEVAAKQLQDYHEKGEKVYMRLNGVRLFSDKASLDEIYMAMFHKTYQEFQEEKECFYAEKKNDASGPNESGKV